MSKNLTQKQMVYRHLRRNKKSGITSMYAFGELGITRLSDIVFKLRKEGHKIRSEYETTTNRYGNRTNYTRYVLEE